MRLFPLLLLLTLALEACTPAPLTLSPALEAEIRDLVREWLLENHPGKLRHVLSLVRSTRGGKDYDAKWGERMTGDGPFAWLIGRRFEMAAERLGFNKRRLKLRTDLFTPPQTAGQQLSLF